MKEFNEKETQHMIRQSLLDLEYQLNHLPLMVDIYDWKDEINYIMKDIETISVETFDDLESLINQSIRLGTKRIMDVDNDVSNKDSEASALEYFSHVGHVISEINRLKFVRDS